jgi:hypothetical protein
MAAPALAEITLAASHQRVDRDTLALARAGRDVAGSFMTEDQRRRAAIINAVIGVHVGPADAASRDFDQDFIVGRNRIGVVTKSQSIRTSVDEGFHASS